MPQSILLLGKNGQVGRALARSLAMHGTVIAYDRATCDLTNARELRSIIRDANPAVIVNSAAYTAVDRAEDDERLCNQVNADAPAVISEEAEKLKAHLIHYSTDYVFDGQKAGLYLESDAPCPISVYGRSKLLGDQAVLSLCSSCTILRVSWIYGVHGRNFPSTILKLAAERGELRVVSDQFGAPTSADLIAEVTTRIAELVLVHGRNHGDRPSDISGIFNLAPSGQVSWHGYAKELIEEALKAGFGLKVSSSGLIPVLSTDYPTRAKRPKNSLLDTTKIRRALSMALPDWRPSVRYFVRDMQAR